MIRTIQTDEITKNIKERMGKTSMLLKYKEESNLLKVKKLERLTLQREQLKYRVRLTNQPVRHY